MPVEGIERTDDDGHVYLALRGTVHRLGELDALRAVLDQVLAADARSIAFGFEGSSYLNSSLVNLIVKTMRGLASAGRPTFIVTSDPEVLESLRIMDLDRVIRILPDREAYRSALQ